MNKTGFSRPGALQMLLAVILAAVVSSAPLVIAMAQPGHEWFMVLSGFPSVIMAMSGVLIAIVYFVGFLRYCANKGYSKWLAFWLFIANVPGFIALLILPDLKVRDTVQLQTENRTAEKPAPQVIDSYINI